MRDAQFYLWMSFGVTALAIAVELICLRLGRARARRLVDEERGLEAQD
ncbi:MAG TPA: heme exporter protein CcmD [Usitatibacter sp.]|nr:heme exporter protein CcmD [Usitatibacter sp.]